jgi:ABC-type uncharacterized transport system fused permease/ATPase subunit
MLEKILVEVKMEEFIKQRATDGWNTRCNWNDVLSGG